MARRFAKVLEEEIEEAFCYPSDLVDTKTTIPLRVGEERWMYTETRSVSVYIHHYSPPLRGIVVYYSYYSLFATIRYSGFPDTPFQIAVSLFSVSRKLSEKSEWV